jgi:hypothetical protein
MSSASEVSELLGCCTAEQLDGKFVHDLDIYLTLLLVLAQMPNSERMSSAEIRAAGCKQTT